MLQAVGANLMCYHHYVLRKYVIIIIQVILIDVNTIENKLSETDHC